MPWAETKIQFGTYAIRLRLTVVWKLSGPGTRPPWPLGITLAFVDTELSLSLVGTGSRQRVSYRRAILISAHRRISYRHSAAIPGAGPTQTDSEGTRLSRTQRQAYPARATANSYRGRWPLWLRKGFLCSEIWAVKGLEYNCRCPLNRGLVVLVLLS